MQNHMSGIQYINILCLSAMEMGVAFFKLLLLGPQRDIDLIYYNNF